MALVSCRFEGRRAEDVDSGLLPLSLLVSWGAGISATGRVLGSSFVGFLEVA